VRVERLRPLDVGHPEGERVLKCAVLRYAHRAAGFTRLHEAVEDLRDGAINRRVCSEACECHQAGQAGGQESSGDVWHLNPGMRQDSHFDSNC